MVAGDSLRKTAGKVMAIEYRLPWKESSGRLQYGLNNPDGVNMVVLMVQDSLVKNIHHCAMAVDGENAFNSVKRQAVLNRLYSTFPELAVFVETWYLQPFPIWFYLQNHVVMVIWSAEGFNKETLSRLFCSRTHMPQFWREYSLGCKLCHQTHNSGLSWMISQPQFRSIWRLKPSKSSQRNWPLSTSEQYPENCTF